MPLSKLTCVELAALPAEWAKPRIQAAAGSGQTQASSSSSGQLPRLAGDHGQLT